MANINKKKKKTKVDPEGVGYIKSTFNNTVITLTDKYGNTISWASAGAVGFKGSRKSTPTNRFFTRGFTTSRTNPSSKKRPSGNLIS